MIYRICIQERRKYATSYVTLTPVDAGCRKVTDDTIPLPDKMQRALGLCCEKDNSFATMSCKEKRNYLFNTKRMTIVLLQ